MLNVVFFLIMKKLAGILRNFRNRRKLKIDKYELCKINTWQGEIRAQNGRKVLLNMEIL